MRTKLFGGVCRRATGPARLSGSPQSSPSTTPIVPAYAGLLMAYTFSSLTFARSGCHEVHTQPVIAPRVMSRTSEASASSSDLISDQRLLSVKQSAPVASAYTRAATCCAA